MRPAILEDQIASRQTPGTKHFPPFEITSELESRAARRIERYPPQHRRAAVLPLLHLVQEEFGFISPEALAWVARQLHLEPIRVEEIVTFYPALRLRRPP